MIASHTRAQDDRAGVLLVDKPVGPSSQQIVSRIKRLFDCKKAGHGGTLDPLASGLMVIGLGEGTKFLQAHLTATKRYRAVVAFGIQTATGDREGEVVAESNRRPTFDELAAVLQRFHGTQKQRPPAYSALKINGRPAYARARAGEDVVLAAREISIYALSCIAFSGDTAEIEVTCSAGTYLRTLAEDIAKACGTVAHLRSLRRTGTGGLSIERAHTFEELDRLSAEARERLLLSPDVLIETLPRIQVSAQVVLGLSRGQVQCWADEREMGSGLVRVYVGNAFHGVARMVNGTLRVHRWMSRPFTGSACINTDA